MQQPMELLDEVKKVYDEYFKEAFDQLGLLKYEEYKNEMGALIKFKNTSFRVLIAIDRGVSEIDISRLFGYEQFIPLEFFNSLLRLQRLDNKASQEERRQILGTRLDYSGQRDFLLDNHSTLSELLSKANYRQTLERIEAIGRERFGH